jgi:hypothetical protein
MNRACGTHPGLEQSAHSERRLLTSLCAIVLCAGLALASLGGTASAATPQNAAQRPSPQKLWKKYPLDPRPSGKSKGIGAAAGSAQAQSLGSGGGSGMPWMALLWTAWIVVALAWAFAFVRMAKRKRGASQPGEGAPDADVPRDHGATAALRDVLRANEERTKLMRPTSSADQVEKLKQKAVRPAKDNGRHDVSVLKAKLGGAPLESACHIEWSPGPEASQFLAMADESESIVLSSPTFKWNEPTPPPTSLPRAAKAHAVLVHELKQAGWRPTGRGEDWYSLELQRRPLVAVREGEA